MVPEGSMFFHRVVETLFGPSERGQESDQRHHDGAREHLLTSFERTRSAVGFENPHFRLPILVVGLNRMFTGGQNIQLLRCPVDFPGEKRASFFGWLSLKGATGQLGPKIGLSKPGGIHE